MKISVEQLDPNVGLTNAWYPSEFDYNPQVLSVNVTFDGHSAPTPIGQDSDWGRPVFGLRDDGTAYVALDGPEFREMARLSIEDGRLFLTRINEDASAEAETFYNRTVLHRY